MNECLSAVLLTPVDKREEFYHLACWLKIDLLVNFLNYFIFVLLIILHHTVEYAQLQIFMLIIVYNFCWTFSNGFEISIKFCVFFIQISKCCEKNICGVILALLPTLNPNTHKTAQKDHFFSSKVNQNIFSNSVSKQQGVKSFHHKFGMQNLWIYYSKA